MMGSFIFYLTQILLTDCACVVLILQNSIILSISMCYDDCYYRDEMTDDEYNESKEDTVEQLKEFHVRLNKITAGDMTIHDKLTTMRLVSIK